MHVPTTRLPAAAENVSASRGCRDHIVGGQGQRLGTPSFLICCTRPPRGDRCGCTIAFPPLNAALFPASPANTHRIATLLGWPARHASTLQVLFNGRLSANYLHPTLVAVQQSSPQSRLLCRSARVARSRPFASLHQTTRPAGPALDLARSCSARDTLSASSDCFDNFAGSHVPLAVCS